MENVKIIIESPVPFGPIEMARNSTPQSGGTAGRNFKSFLIAVIIIGGILWYTYHNQIKKTSEERNFDDN